MIKSVNIDGKDYVIRQCTQCPFFHDGCWEYNQRCQHPKGARIFTEAEFDVDSIAKNCPLGTVKKCDTCKHEGKDERAEPCSECKVYDIRTWERSAPSKWEVKE